jgi:hypothetical protein
MIGKHTTATHLQKKKFQGYKTQLPKHHSKILGGFFEGKTNNWGEKIDDLAA